MRFKASKCFLAAALVFAASSAWAQETTPLEAAERMKAFMNTPQRLIPRGARTETSEVITMDYDEGRALLDMPVDRLRSRDIKTVKRTTVVEPPKAEDKDGCHAYEKHEFPLQIPFKINSHELSGNAAQVLDTLAAAIKSGKIPVKPVVITGHTDKATGSGEFNRVLSWARAFRVQAYLVEKHGIPKDGFKAVGYAGEKPRCNETIPGAIERNRRVEFRQPEPGEIAAK